MKARIDSNGLLLIYRFNHWKQQKCPYAFSSVHFGYCGDHCPQFGEPAPQDYPQYRLRVCNHLLEFDSIEDFRGNARAALGGL